MCASNYTKETTWRGVADDPTATSQPPEGKEYRLLHRDRPYDDGTVRGNIQLTEKGVFLRILISQEFLAQIQTNRGVILSRQEKYKEAEADYRRALKLDPLAQTVYYNRGNDWLLREKYKKALMDLTRAKELNPKDAEAWNNRGVCYLKMGKKENAKQDFERALSIKPGFQKARDNFNTLKE